MCDFQPTIEEAVIIATFTGKTVTYTVREVTVTIEHDTDLDLMRRDFFRAWKGYIHNEIGPYPKEVLSEEELANDARIEAEILKRVDIEMAKKVAIVKARKALNEKLLTAPEIELSDPESWQEFIKESSNSPHKNTVVFASRWGRLMQIAGKDQELEDIAESTYEEACSDGIGDFSYYDAVNALVKCWKQGAPFNQWYQRYKQLNLRRTIS